jgi:hypothetical protein
MQEGYGGPVWHVSIAAMGNLPHDVLLREAYRQLDGVGDAAAGEWIERRWMDTGEPVVHLRRRLNAIEAAVVGPVRDIRGTAEAFRRLQPVRHLLPAGYTE